MASQKCACVVGIIDLIDQELQELAPCFSRPLRALSLRRACKDLVFAGHRDGHAAIHEQKKEHLSKAFGVPCWVLGSLSS